MHSSLPTLSVAKATVSLNKDACVVTVSGDWSLEASAPSWQETSPRSSPSEIRISADHLGTWDTALVLFLLHAQVWCTAKNKKLETSSLPANLQRILAHTEIAAKPRLKHKRKPISLRFLVGTEVLKLWSSSIQTIDFVGNCTLGVLRLAIGKAKWRFIDFLLEMQRCWESALPIVSFISFLVGVILAFQSAVQLKQYGASILVADLVGLAVVREMGPMMAAIVVAGSTGAGFAAQLGNMKVDEEIDALETFGIPAIDFLVLPRLLAVTIMMPILAIYADILGILGGVFLSVSMLGIPASAYWVETQNRITFTDVASGITKSFVFGILIALAGCLRGIHCERTTAGVGNATSSAVVSGIMLIIIADALFAVIYNALGI